MTVRELRAGAAVLRVDPQDGGRWTSLVVDGLELLSGAEVAGVPPGVRSGCFVMAPFAGRVRDGALCFRGRTHQLPRDAPPHAIHGTVFDALWEVVAGDETRLELAVDLAAPWPFAGTVRQELVLRPDRLESTLVLHATEDMPVTLGLHPWFPRRLARGGEVVLDVQGRQQYVLDADGLPTGALSDPRPGPYDDCFRGTLSPPRLTWPGALELTMTSSADHWVVFDQHPDAFCVEPQTGPPDACALGLADVVAAGDDLVLVTGLSWLSGP